MGELNKKILLDIKQKISSKHPKAEIYLYGSRARGDFQNDSDWDILILLNEKKVTPDVESNLMDSIYDIELETGEIISPLIYSKNYWNNTLCITPLYFNVNKDGLKL